MNTIILRHIRLLFQSFPMLVKVLLNTVSESQNTVKYLTIYKGRYVFCDIIEFEEKIIIKLKEKYRKQLIDTNIISED